MIAIRPAREDDYATLARVWLEGYRASSPEGTEEPPVDELRTRLAHEVGSGEWSLFAATDEDRIVAILAITRDPGILNQLFVGDGYRSRGVGKMLLAHARREMPGGFRLRTHITNTKAQAFYEREGMRHTHDGPHPNHPEAMFRHYAWSAY